MSRYNPRERDGSLKPKLNVMVTVHGVNEHGKVITDVHQLTFTSEAEMMEWINSAHHAQVVDDEGPPIRFEMTPKN